MSKPNILLVVDKPNWAYDHMANFIINELSDKYNFHKLIAEYHLKVDRQSIHYKIKRPYRYLKSLWDESFDKNIEYDILVYLWWFIPEMIDMKISTKHELRGIFTESFPPGRTIDFKGNVSEFIDACIKPAHGIIAGNRNIFDFYQPYDFPVHYSTGATNTTPGNFSFNKVKREDEQLRVCWTGNPNRNFKGFYEFVEPAVKLAQKQRPNIVLVTRFSGPLDTLPEFYSTVDVMLNASIGDAGPGFIIDAGGCGIPTISTNLGFATEIIEDKVNGMIVERNIEHMAEKLIDLHDDRVLLKTMSENIATDIKANWGHAPRAAYWHTMFRNILSKNQKGISSS